MSSAEVFRNYDFLSSSVSNAAQNQQSAQEISIKENLYFARVNDDSLNSCWDSIIKIEGESNCNKVMFLNNYHIFFCRKKVYLVPEGKGVISPFCVLVEGRPLDVYLDRVSPSILYIVVALNCGLYAALINTAAAPTVILDWKYVQMDKSVEKIHRIENKLFALCYDDCSIQNVRVNIYIQESFSSNKALFDSFALDDSQTEEGGDVNGQYNVALRGEISEHPETSIDFSFQERKGSGYGRMYVSSFFHSTPYLPSYLLLLSDVDIRLIEFGKDAVMQIVTSVSTGLKKIGAIVPPLANFDSCYVRNNNGESWLIGTAYFFNGQKKNIWAVSSSAGFIKKFLLKQEIVRQLHFEPFEQKADTLGLLNGMKQNVSVFAFAEGGGSLSSSSATVLYDNESSSLVLNSVCLPVHQKLLSDAYPPSILTSTMSQFDNVIGISYKPLNQSGVSIDGLFYIYQNSRVHIIAKRSSNEVLCGLTNQLLADLRELDTSVLSRRDISNLLWYSVLAGSSTVDAMESVWSVLLNCIRKSGETVTLSPLAHALSAYWLSEIDLLNSLVSKTTFRPFSDFVLMDEIRERLLYSLQVAKKAIPDLSEFSYHRSEIKNRYNFFLYSPTVICVASANAGESLSEAMEWEAQMVFLTQLIEGVSQACVLSFLFFVDQKYETNLKDVSANNPFDLKALLWSPEAGSDELSFCKNLLQLKDKNVTETLYAKRDIFLPCARILIEFHWHLLDKDGYTKALSFIERNIVSVSENSLVDYILFFLEAGAPHILPTLKVRLAELREGLNPKAEEQIIEQLEKTPTEDLLYKSLRCLFETLSLHQKHGGKVERERHGGSEVHLREAVLEWIKEHSISDERIDTLATIVNEFDLAVQPGESLAETFFWCWKEYSRGKTANAAHYFADLAMSPLPCSLDARLKCIELAVQHQSLTQYQYAAFLLRLQRRLWEIVTELAEATETTYPVAETLKYQFLEDKQLLTVAQGFHDVGGAFIELDILQHQQTVSPAVLYHAARDALVFLHVKGYSPESAIVELLRTHYHQFRVPLPLHAFIDFFCANGQSLKDVVPIFLQENVPIAVVFDTFLAMTEKQTSNHSCYPVVEVVQILSQSILPQVEDTSLKRRFRLHLIENIQRIDGEYRGYFLSTDDSKTLSLIEEELNNSK